jgi:hypothetical protein
MRHLPSIGAIPVPGTAELFMVIKQDAGGTCFVVSDNPMDWLLEHCSRHARARGRDIGAQDHATRSDLRDADLRAEPVTVSGDYDEPPF